MQAMTGLINYRLSKTRVNLVPVYANIRGVPIIIGADPEKPTPFYGGAGWAGTALFANIPDAIQQTQSDIETFRNEVFTVANFGGSPLNKPVSDYYVNVVIPFLRDWNEFADKHSHGWSKLWDNFIIGSGFSTWHSLNQYRQRLLDMRKSAEAIMTFNAPKPIGPNIDIVQQGLNKAADAGIAIWDVLKYVIIIGTVAVAILTVIYIGGAM